MNTKDNFILFYFLLAFSSSFSQEGIQSEKKWLIDYHFRGNIPVNKKLTQIADNILRGKYAPAKELIFSLKISKENDLVVGAALSYEAIVQFNEGFAGKSVELCDSAIFFLNKRFSETRYFAKVLNAKAKAQNSNSQKELAKKTIDEAISLALKLKDTFNLAHSYFILTWMNGGSEDIRNKNSYLIKSLDLRKKIHDEAGIAACLAYIGFSQAEIGNYDLALTNLLQSVSIRERINDKRGLANSYLGLNELYIRIDELLKALEAEEKSLQVCKEIGDLRCVSECLKGIAFVHQSRNEFEKALKYNYEAIYLMNVLNDRFNLPEVYRNITQIHISRGNLDLAEEKIDSCISIEMQVNDSFGLMASQLLQAKIKFYQKNYPATITIANRVLAKGNLYKNVSALRDANLLLSETYEKINQSAKALPYYKRFVSIRDSIYDIEKSKKLLRTDLEYEFKKEQENLKFEEEKKRAVLNEKNEQQKSVIRISVIASAVLGLLLFFGIFQYRQKTKSEKKQRELNKELEQKNITIKENLEYAHKIEKDIILQRIEAEKSAAEIQLAKSELRTLRSQMNPHFIFNAINSIQSYVMLNEADMAQKYLTKFARLMRAVLENSKHEFVPLTKELEALQLYMELEALRASFRFDFNIVLAEGLVPENFSIPPMLLQPYVENAILHGLTPLKTRKGILQVSFSAKEDQLLCTIEDNGIGREEAQRIKLKKDAGRKSLGMEINQERMDRLSLHANTNVKARIVDKFEEGEASGTRVEIIIQNTTK